MADPLTWHNIGNRGNASLISAITQAGQAAGDSFANFGKTIGEFVDKRTEDETAALLARIRDEDNAAVRDTIIKAATDKSDFLDLDLISQTDYELGQPARDLEIQLAAETRAMDQGKTLAEFEGELEMDIFRKQESVKHANYIEAQEQQNVLLAAREMTLQDDQQAHLIEINNADNKRLIEIAKIKAEEENNKLSKKTLRGIDKLIDRLTHNGKFSLEEIGMVPTDLQHFGLFRDAALKTELFTEEEFDEYIGNHLIFNDNMGLNPFNQNDFSFVFRGKTYNIGKAFQTDFEGENNDILAIQAAVVASVEDEATRTQSWLLYSKALTDIGETPNHNEFTLDFRKYIHAIGSGDNPLKQLDEDEFMAYYLTDALENVNLADENSQGLVSHLQMMIDKFINKN